MPVMDERLVMGVIGGIVGGLLLFSVLVLLGGVIVRRLGLPQDLPEGAHYSPPAPPLAVAGDRVRAQATAALQARRAALFSRARKLAGRGETVIAGLGLDAEELTRAEADMTAIEATPDSQAS